MNVIFTVIFFISLIVMTIIAPDKLLSSLLGGAEKSAATALTLFCIYAVWMGLSRLAEKSGFSRGAARALKPLTKKIFKTENDIALENLAMNLSCNLLGIGGAATPYAVKAIGELEKDKNDFGVIHTRQVTAPTLMSMPPVIITRLMPQERTMREALLLRMFRKFWGLVNPPPRKRMADRYRAKKTRTVMVSSRLVSERSRRALRRGALLAVVVMSLRLLCDAARPGLEPQARHLAPHHRGAEHHQQNDHHRLVGGQGRGGHFILVKRGGEELDDIGPQDGAVNVELATGEGIAPQGHRQDGVHLNILRDTGVIDGAAAADADEARHRHAHAQDHVGEQLDHLRVQAIEAGGIGVDAHRLGVEPQGGESQHQPEHHRRQV